MPLQATSGAASQDAFGGNGVAVVPAYIEDVFSTTLFTGTDTNPNTITNGIDLSTKGGLVWIKERNAGNHSAWDTARGVKNLLIPNLTNENLNIPVTYPAYPTYGLQSFNTTGFTLGKNWEGENAASSKIVSWTFRKQPKFFDIVTYTGTGVARTVAHNLGSVPGCIIVKRTDTAGFDWIVYHRSTGNTNRLLLNDTVPAASGTSFWNDTTPTSTVFTVGTNVNGNASGGTYVAYLFAHDAGGFGLTGTDNVISCGSFTADGSGNATVTLGYEPQWITQKLSSGTGNWETYDTMRGWSQTQIATLYPNLSSAEGGGAATLFYPTATGFQWVGGALTAGGTYIYIAIRRGPMKVPTTGTSVFATTTYTGNGSTQNISTSINADWVLNKSRNNTEATISTTRLAGYSRIMQTDRGDAEIYIDPTYFVTAIGNTGFSLGLGDGNSNTYTYVSWDLKRAPGFFDVVCYTGTGVARTVSHNLAAVPEWVIVKRRNASNNWAVYSAALGNGNRVFLNQTQASAADSALWNNTTPTSSVFTVGTAFATNNSGDTYVAYLFATCAGVSKCTSFTGNGTSQTINCGFTSGARFVMIKATSTTGNWTVFDSARGISAGGDPALYLNSTAAEVTGIDAIDADSTGFIVNQEGTFNLNASGVQYLVLAIA